MPRLFLWSLLITYIINYLTRVVINHFVKKMSIIQSDTFLACLHAFPHFSLILLFHPWVFFYGLNFQLFTL